MTDSPTPEDRPTREAIWRGWRGRCPACGEGRIFAGYLALRPRCPACGEDLSHQRADDGPAYLTILVVGHLMAPLLLWVYPVFRPGPWTIIAIFATGTVVLSLLLLPRFKGALVGLQWAKRMHGFGGPDQLAGDRHG